MWNDISTAQRQATSKTYSRRKGGVCFKNMRCRFYKYRKWHAHTAFIDLLSLMLYSNINASKSHNFNCNAAPKYEIYKQINAVSADMDTVLEGWQTSVRDVNKQPGIWNACASHLMAKLFKKRKNQTFSCS